MAYVIIAASNVNTGDPVPTVAAIVIEASPQIAEVLPARHNNDVAEDHAAVLQISTIRFSERVWLVRPKLRPVIVTELPPEPAKFPIKTDDAALSNVNAGVDVPVAAPTVTCKKPNSCAKRLVRHVVDVPAVHAAVKHYPPLLPDISSPREGVLSC